MRTVAVIALVTLAVLTGPSAQTAAQQPSGVRTTPKLVVLISVDQMRGDYIDRFQHQWRPR